MEVVLGPFGSLCMICFGFLYHCLWHHSGTSVSDEAYGTLLFNGSTFQPVEQMPEDRTRELQFCTMMLVV